MLVRSIKLLAVLTFLLVTWEVLFQRLSVNCEQLTMPVAPGIFGSKMKCVVAPADEVP